MARSSALAGILFALFAAAPTGASPRAVAAPFGSEVAFEANAGQHDARVRFVARGRRDTLLVTPDRGVLLLPNAKDGDSRVALRFGLDGARTDATCRGEDELRGRANYYLGNDSKRWRTGIARFGRVVCSDVRPGVDVVYYGRDGRIEWDVVVAPGADASNLFVRFEGADSIAVEKDGSLALRGAFGTLSQHAPRAFQRDGGEERAIEAKWTVAEGGARLALGAHDARLALVVDPVIEYAAPLGGTADDAAVAIGIDAAGNLHVAGETTSIDFPGASGAPGGSSDAFWVVLSPDGATLLRATYFGGSGAETMISPYGYLASGSLAVAPDGGALLVGTTTSTDLPTLHAAQSTYGGGVSDAFAVRFAPGGAGILWSTYLGGGGYYTDTGAGGALDAVGNAYVVGSTSSADFPTHDAFQPLFEGIGLCLPWAYGCGDAFVTKIPPVGDHFVYSTFLGGTGFDEASDVAVDGYGAVYLVGSTTSTDFPVQNALQPDLDAVYDVCSQFGPCTDAFITKLYPNGRSLVFSTYLGGFRGEGATAVALHPAGAVLVAGYTDSSDFPTVDAAQPTNGGQRDDFVALFDGSGTQLRYATYLGGPDTEMPSDAVIDAQGVATIVGWTGPWWEYAFDVDRDVSVAQVGPTGVIGTSMTFGGAARDQAMGVALDAGANPWLVGSTLSNDFPTVATQQPVRAADGFVVELGPAPGDLACNVDFSQPSYTNGQTVQVTSLRFQNTTLLPKPVRLRLTLAPPGQSAFTAADLTTWFAPGFSAQLAPVNLFTVTPAHPRGTLSMRCELLDAGDGTARASDVGNTALN